MNRLREAARDLDGSVAVDLHEADEAYLLVVDVPGATEETTRINASKEAIRVTANRAFSIDDEAEVVRRERPEAFEFEFPIPADADGEEADASLARGILEIRIPRGSVGTDIPITEE